MMKSILRVADLRQQVYDALKSRITDGDFPLNTRFQEINLAQELGVSRTPVREALAMLVRDGLLVQATRGFVFPRFSPQDITDSIEIRLLLEPYAIRRMVEESSPEMMKSLGQRIRRLLMDVGKSAKYPEALRASREAIYEHIRNQQLVETLRRFEDRVHYMRIATLKTPDARKISYDGMMRLAEAIEVGDAENAQAFMRRQLTNALQAYLDIRAREEQKNWEPPQRRRGSAR